MHFSFDMSWTDLPPKQGDTVSQLLLGAIALPLLLSFMKSVGASIGHRREDFRRRRTLLGTLAGEIYRIQSVNDGLFTQFHQALRSGTFAIRIAKDARYYIYVASGQDSQIVFNNERLDFWFLRRASMNAIIAYYEMQSLIYESLEGLKSDEFRDLPPRRKLDQIQRVEQMLAGQPERMRQSIVSVMCEQIALSRNAWRYFHFELYMRRSTKLIGLRHHHPRFWVAATRSMNCEPLWIRSKERRAREQRALNGNRRKRLQYLGSDRKG